MFFFVFIKPLTKLKISLTLSIILYKSNNLLYRKHRKIKRSDTLAKKLEVILDTNPSGGCGCNCGCSGTSKVEELEKLVEELKEYNFSSEILVDKLPISELDTTALINKINILLNNTNAAFRVNEENIEEALDNILPLVVLDDVILTAYGVPTLNDVVVEVQKNI